MRIVRRIDRIEKFLGEEAFVERPYAHLSLEELLEQIIQIIEKMGRERLGDLYDEFAQLSKENKISCVKGGVSFDFRKGLWGEIKKIMSINVEE